MESQDRRRLEDPTAMDNPSAAGTGFALKAAMNSAAILEAGVLLAGRYEIVSMLGLGGMGAVYKAYDRDIERVIALKVIRPDLASYPEVLQRFKQELLLARKVAHKNVVRIFDVRESGGVKFITMEYIEGRDLASLLEEGGKLPVAEALGIMKQVCAGLAAAHEEGVIHRDLKPSNIMRDQNGRVVVMDFGLARNIGGGGMTQTGAMLGTMQYMSPEQAKAEPLDERSDLFTVGLILYELITGKTPYQADSALASLLKRTKERAVSMSEIDASIPRALSAMVAKCLETDPKNRYQSVNELIATLEGLQGKQSGMQPVSEKLHFARWMLVSLVAVAAIAIVALAVGVFFRLRTPPAAHKPVTVLVADLTNHTGDPVFDGTLEPMFNAALEGARFVNTFNRGQARKLAQQLPKSTDKLDEQSARLVAVSQGISSVVTTSLSRRADGYRLSAEAMDAVTGNMIADAEVSASTKDELLLAIPRLAAPIRKALGDSTPESDQISASGGTFTAASLEAAHEYGVGMEQQFGGNMETALHSFTKATELDPNFARAYSGMAATSRNLGHQEDAERYFKLALEHVDRMTERERYRTRGLYYVATGNFEKCVEEYGELVKEYPVDNIGHSNLAVCYRELGNMPKAVEEARKALEIYPKQAIQRMNLSLYASYAGDFRTAEREAAAVQELNPAYEKAYLAQAYAQLGHGQVPQAQQTYHRLEKLSPLGASIAASGLGDVAVYQGRFADAEQILQTGANADLAAKTPDRAAAKLAARAYTLLSSGRTSAARADAELVLNNSKKANLRFLAARILIETGDAAKAQAVAAELASKPTREPQADAKLLEGEAALKGKNAQKAIQLFTQANSILNTWIGRFDLGRAYLAAGLFPEADSEFDLCLKRRGEALELEDGPTYGYFPPVYYYLGRVREGLKSPAFAESYRRYVDIRGQAAEDPLLVEIARRLRR
jgi:eukaryotic-like serine/threonine-protein kinase